MEFKLVYGYTDDIITSLVNKYIKEGWKPQGGICIGRHGFYQGMVREGKSKCLEE